MTDITDLIREIFDNKPDPEEHAIQELKTKLISIFKIPYWDVDLPDDGYIFSSGKIPNSDFWVRLQFYEKWTYEFFFNDKSYESEQEFETLEELYDDFLVQLELLK